MAICSSNIASIIPGSWTGNARSISACLILADSTMYE